MIVRETSVKPTNVVALTKLNTYVSWDRWRWRRRQWSVELQQLQLLQRSTLCCYPKMSKLHTHMHTSPRLMVRPIPNRSLALALLFYRPTRVLLCLITHDDSYVNVQSSIVGEWINYYTYVLSSSHIIWISPHKRSSTAPMAAKRYVRGWPFRPFPAIRRYNDHSKW